MKPYIVQLEIDDRKSIVYCKVQYTKGDASVIVSLQMMTVKMKTAFDIKMMMVQQYF